MLSGIRRRIGLQRQWSLVIRVACTYIGTVIGAGFATGQEILQFFTVYGTYSMIGILICTILFAWLGVRMMLIGARLGAQSYQELNHFLFGERLGSWMSHLVGIMLCGVTLAMLAGAGALFEEQLHLSHYLGLFLTASITFWVVSRGIRGILSINTIVVPLMFLLIVAIGWITWQSGEIGLLFEQAPERTAPHWLLSAISYVAFNLVLSQAVLVPLGASIRDESTIRWGGWLGALGLGTILLISNGAMLLKLDQLIHTNIPMGWVITELGATIQVLFLLVIWGEIVTTLIGDVFGLTNMLSQGIHIRREWIVAILLFIGSLLSFIGFANLVRYLYPLFGYSGLCLICILLVRRLPR
jgi:uncharacterized membrane protein YkvI